MTEVLGAENIINFGEYTKEDNITPYFYKYNTSKIPINFKFYPIKELGLKLLNYPINKGIKDYFLNNINMFIPKEYFEQNINCYDVMKYYTINIAAGVYEDYSKRIKNKVLKIVNTPTVPEVLIFHILLRNCSFNPDRPEFIINTQIIDKSSMLKIGTNTEVKEVL